MEYLEFSGVSVNRTSSEVIIGTSITNGNVFEGQLSLLVVGVIMALLLVCLYDATSFHGRSDFGLWSVMIKV